MKKYYFLNIPPNNHHRGPAWKYSYVLFLYRSLSYFYFLVSKCSWYYSDSGRDNQVMLFIHQCRLRSSIFLYHLNRSRTNGYWYFKVSMIVTKVYKLFKTRWLLNEWKIADFALNTIKSIKHVVKKTHLLWKLSND